MNDHLVGRAFRAVRVRRRRRQSDVARDAAVSRWTVARIERGHVEGVSLATIRSMARVLDISVEIAVRWQGAELDRVLGAGHDALGEVVVRILTEAGGWELAAEVSLSIWGERGVIDLLAFHVASHTLPSTNRRRLAQHRALLRLAFPDDGRGIRGWLVSPQRDVAALTFLPDERAAHLALDSDRHRRVRNAAAPLARPHEAS